MESKLVMSVDYEIFGSGTGDVRNHMIDPTESMARTCEKSGVPLTIFFEVEEYVGFCRHARELNQLAGYDPGREIRGQVIDLARRGHDVQLHTHPKWVGAQFCAGHWSVRQEELTVDELFETQEETNEYISSRKAIIDEMLDSAVPGRRATAYRAGALRAQPGKKLLAALAANDITIDSSVVWGLQDHKGQFPLDYRTAPQKRRLWRVRDDVCHEDPGGRIWEIPIHSVMRRRVHKLTPTRLRAKFSSSVPVTRRKEIIEEIGIPRNPFQSFRFLFQATPVKLDFHNMSPASLLQHIRSASPPAHDDPFDVLVLLGHSKEHFDDESFERFISSVARDPDLKVVSFGELAHLLEQENLTQAGSLLPTAQAMR